MKRTIGIVITQVIFILAVVGVSLAADYPTKPITLINPMPPGGTLDLQARAFATIAEKML
jgi:tripartite-type tricarboxylate transporter receptor subunit TctC